MHLTMSEDIAAKTAVDTHAAKPPLREVLVGSHAKLVPLSTLHSHELYMHLCKELQSSTFAYLGHGPFENEQAFETFIAQRITPSTTIPPRESDPVFFAVITQQAILKEREGVTVVVAAPGSAVGYLALTDMNLAHRTIEIGPVTLAPVLQRTTASTEAVFLAMRYGLDTLGNRRLEWTCDARNAGSRRAAERLGFTYEGTLRQHRIHRGRNRDTDLFSIIDGEEWDVRRKAIESWLDPSNFLDGRQIRSLENVRESMTMG